MTAIVIAQTRTPTAGSTLFRANSRTSIRFEEFIAYDPAI